MVNNFNNKLLNKRTTQWSLFLILYDGIAPKDLIYLKHAKAVVYIVNYYKFFTM